MTDPFSDARSGFVKLDDMLGRSLLFIPQSHETRKSTIKGQEDKDVLTVITDIVILDGPVTDLIETVPLTLSDVPIMSSVLTAQLKSKIGRKAPDGVTPAMVLGRLGQQSTAYGKNSKAWVLETVESDEVRDAARQAAKQYAAADDPFA